VIAPVESQGGVLGEGLEERPLLGVGRATIVVTSLVVALCFSIRRHYAGVRQILREVWGPAAREVHYVRVHMAELRKKIEAEPARPRLLVTEPGVGYRLRDPVDAPG